MTHREEAWKMCRSGSSPSLPELVRADKLVDSLLVCQVAGDHAHHTALPPKRFDEFPRPRRLGTAS